MGATVSHMSEFWVRDQDQVALNIEKEPSSGIAGHKMWKCAHKTFIIGSASEPEAKFLNLFFFQYFKTDNEDVWYVRISYLHTKGSSSLQKFFSSHFSIFGFHGLLSFLIAWMLGWWWLSFDIVCTWTNRNPSVWIKSKNTSLHYSLVCSRSWLSCHWTRY